MKEIKDEQWKINKRWKINKEHMKKWTMENKLKWTMKNKEKKMDNEK